MSMLTLKKAFELIDKNLDKGHVSGPKPENLVNSAEEALGLLFPPTYRTFLKQYGCGGIGGVEIYGVIKEDFENSGPPDAIWKTLSERKFKNLPSPAYCLPRHLILIAFADDGDYYALDTSQKNADGESPVVIWALGGSTISDKLEKIADDFGDFLLNMIEADLLSDEEELMEND